MTVWVYAIAIAFGFTALLFQFWGARSRRTGTHGLAARLEALETENDEVQLSIDSLRLELSEAKNAIAGHVETQAGKHEDVQADLETLRSALSDVKRELAQGFSAQEKRVVKTLQEIDALMRAFMMREQQRALDSRKFVVMARAMLQEYARGAVLYTHSGEKVTGERLAQVIEDALTVAGVSEKLSNRVPTDLLEQAAIAGVLSPELLRNQDQASEAAMYVAHRLNALRTGPVSGWIGTASPEGLAFSRETDGKPETYSLDHALFDGPEAETLDFIAGDLQTIYLKPANLVRKNSSFDVRTPSELLKAVFGRGDTRDRLADKTGVAQMAGVAA